MPDTPIEIDHTRFKDFDSLGLLGLEEKQIQVLKQQALDSSRMETIFKQAHIKKPKLLESFPPDFVSSIDKPGGLYNFFKNRSFLIVFDILQHFWDRERRNQTQDGQRDQEFAKGEALSIVF